jgi:chromosome segregation ATPase
MKAEAPKDEAPNLDRPAFASALRIMNAAVPLDENEAKDAFARALDEYAYRAYSSERVQMQNEQARLAHDVQAGEAALATERERRESLEAQYEDLREQIIDLSRSVERYERELFRLRGGI